MNLVRCAQQGVILFGLVLVALMPSEAIYAEFGSIVDIGVAGDFYFSDGSANNWQGYANLLIKNEEEADKQSSIYTDLHIDVGAGGLIAGTGHNYIKAPQVYFQVGFKDSFEFTIGRYKRTWSFLDSYWDMGLSHPLFLWDGSRPEEQGLTGLFLKIPIYKSISLKVFGSPIFLPTQGASYEISDGKVTSSNPWFSEPVKAIAFTGQKIDLNFTLDTPKAQDVVLQTSYGLSLGTALNRYGLLLNAFYLKKPSNDLVLPFEGGLNLSTFQGDINIKPQVATHEVAGLDIGWNFSKLKIIASWLREFSLDYSIPENTTYPVFPDQDMYSLATRFKLTKTQRLWLSYVQVDREKTEIQGLFSSAQIDTFALRNRFEKAVQAKWIGLLFRRKKGYKVKTIFSATYDPEAKNVWFSSDIRWAARPNMEVFARCDFFGSSNPKIVSKDFISTYQNNDRCLLGGHYAF